MAENVDGEIRLRLIAEDAAGTAGVGGASTSPGAPSGGRSLLSSEQREQLRYARENQRRQREQSEYNKLVLGQEKNKTGIFAQMKGILGVIGIAVTAGELVKRSKIMSTALSSFMDIFGALIDIFLLPLIPILIPVMQGLAKLVPVLLTWVQKMMADPLGGLQDLFVDLPLKFADALVDKLEEALRKFFPEIELPSVPSPSDFVDAAKEVYDPRNWGRNIMDMPHHLRNLFQAPRERYKQEGITGIIEDIAMMGTILAGVGGMVFAADRIGRMGQPWMPTGQGGSGRMGGARGGSGGPGRGVGGGGYVFRVDDPASAFSPFGWRMENFAPEFDITVNIDETGGIEDARVDDRRDTANAINVTYNRLAP